MTYITIYKNWMGQVVRFKAEGHAMAGAKGQDIVCAAVSVLSQSLIIGLENVVKTKLDCFVSEDKALIDCSMDKEVADKRHDANVLFNTYELTIEQLQSQFRDNICLIYEGV